MNAARNKTLMGWMCLFCCLEAISFVVLVSSQACFLMFSHQSSNATWRLVVWQQAWRDTGLVPLRRQGPRSTITRMEDPMGRASLIPKGGKGRYCHDVLHEVLHFSSWCSEPFPSSEVRPGVENRVLLRLSFSNFSLGNQKRSLCVSKAQ